MTCGDSTMAVHPVLPGLEEGGSIPTSPLQFNYEIIAPTGAARLNARWHSVLPYVPTFHIEIAFAAFFNGDPFAVAIWGRPVARTICNQGWLELRRMAISPLAPKNTASNMLGWMKRKLKIIRPEIVKLISYQDTQHHKGTIYKAVGWSPVDMSNSPVNWGGFSQTETEPTRLRNGKILPAPKIRWESEMIPFLPVCSGG